MAPDMSFIRLIGEASLIVQLVMGLLMLMSLTSWIAIFKKRMNLTQARREADHFEDEFWSGADLAALYTRTRRQDAETYGIAAIFQAGFQEFLRLRNQPSIDPEAVLGSSQRAMRAALTRETDELEMQLPLLATVGSSSPYIGLFGTVWGIMNSFRALSGVQQATLSQVAPGIAEALIATAMGLFAAIPAVIAYNRYVTETDRLLSRYESFIEEFANILHRQTHTLRTKPRTEYES